MDEHTTESAKFASEYRFECDCTPVPKPLKISLAFSPLDDICHLSLNGTMIAMTGHDMDRLAKTLRGTASRRSETRKEMKAIVLDSWARRNAAEDNAVDGF